MMMRSGLNLSRISSSVFSIRPTMVQHLTVSSGKLTPAHKHPFRISETPVMLPCLARRESTVMSASKDALELTLDISVLVLEQDNLLSASSSQGAAHLVVLGQLLQ